MQTTLTSYLNSQLANFSAAQSTAMPAAQPALASAVPMVVDDPFTGADEQAMDTREDGSANPNFCATSIPRPEDMVRPAQTDGLFAVVIVGYPVGITDDPDSIAPRISQLPRRFAMRLFMSYDRAFEYYEAHHRANTVRIIPPPTPGHAMNPIYVASAAPSPDIPRRKRRHAEYASSISRGRGGAPATGVSRGGASTTVVSRGRGGASTLAVSRRGGASTTSAVVAPSAAAVVALSAPAVTAVAAPLALAASAVAAPAAAAVAIAAAPAPVPAPRMAAAVTTASKAPAAAVAMAPALAPVPAPRMTAAVTAASKAPPTVTLASGTFLLDNSTRNSAPTLADGTFLLGPVQKPQETPNKPAASPTPAPRLNSSKTTYASSAAQTDLPLVVISDSEVDPETDDRPVHVLDTSEEDDMPLPSYPRHASAPPALSVPGPVQPPSGSQPDIRPFPCPSPLSGLGSSGFSAAARLRLIEASWKPFVPPTSNRLNGQGSTSTANTFALRPAQTPAANTPSTANVLTPKPAKTPAANAFALKPAKTPAANNVLTPKPAKTPAANTPTSPKPATPKPSKTPAPNTPTRLQVIEAALTPRIAREDGSDAPTFALARARIARADGSETPSYVLARAREDGSNTPSSTIAQAPTSTPAPFTPPATASTSYAAATYDSGNDADTDDAESDYSISEFDEAELDLVFAGLTRSE